MARAMGKSVVATTVAVAVTMMVGVMVVVMVVLPVAVSMVGTAVGVGPGRERPMGRVLSSLRPEAGVEVLDCRHWRCWVQQLETWGSKALEGGGGEQRCSETPPCIHSG